MKNIISLICVISVLGISGCTTEHSIRLNCTTDADCPESECLSCPIFRCVDGTCVPEQPTCISNDECRQKFGVNYICRNGICEQDVTQMNCEEDSDCPLGMCPNGSSYKLYQCDLGTCREIPFSGDTCEFVCLNQLPILESGEAATNLQAALDCQDYRTGVAELTWSPAGSGKEQKIQWTIYRNGFENNMFSCSEPLSMDKEHYALRSLSGQAIHKWRVLTLTEQGWVPSEIASFEGPTCVADYIDN